MSILLITSVEMESKAIGRIDGAVVIAGGIGRTNAASATTEAILKRGPFQAVIAAGIAGVLPGSDLILGQAVVASSCIYVEEGIVTASGFSDMRGLGFSLGDFDGNAVPVDEGLLEALGSGFAIGPIATVATCSGTDEAALQVVRRTGAIAEAMEGAAVVHAARRLRTAAIELRIISNTTGDRSRQQWDIGHALAQLGPAAKRAVELIDAADRT